MNTMKRMQNLLWIMTTMSILGVVGVLAVTATIGSQEQHMIVGAHVILSGIMAILCGIQYSMAKEMPFGSVDFRQEVIHSLVVLLVQGCYYGLMLVGAVNEDPWDQSWGSVFGFLGYFSIFLILYRFNERKKAVDFTEKDVRRKVK